MTKTQLADLLHAGLWCMTYNLVHRTHERLKDRRSFGRKNCFDAQNSRTVIIAATDLRIVVRHARDNGSLKELTANCRKLCDKHRASIRERENRRHAPA